MRAGPSLEGKNASGEFDPIANPLDAVGMQFDQSRFNLVEHPSQIFGRVSFNWEIYESHVTHQRSRYRVRLKETLARTSIMSMKASRKIMSPLTAAKSAPLKRICLIALTEWVSGLKCAKVRSHGGKLSTG